MVTPYTEKYNCSIFTEGVFKREEGETVREKKTDRERKGGGGGGGGGRENERKIRI